MTTLRIRPYEPEHDQAQAYALWHRTLGSLWPLSEAVFRRKTLASGVYQPGDHLVAEASNRVVGFVGTQARLVPGEGHPRGELMVLLVDPEYQRRGIGRRLLDAALTILKRQGVQRVQLGAGGVSYFWAGVPTNLPGAWAFFEACGWTEAERSFDLVRTLESYATPPWVQQRARQADIEIGTARPADMPAVLVFEAEHFPQWLRYYETVAEQGKPEDVVLARDAGGQIVGTSSVLDPGAGWRRHDFVWERLLGANTGGVGPLGVAEAMRELGIGLALAARVTELLKERGVETSYVGYTWLVDWYGKLGYRVWREYRMSCKTL